jgi:single-strand DNA-binding protein
LIGNLVRDPELRYTPNGAAVADFRMAINREYTDREGEKRSETCFVDIVAWQKQAEFCDKFLTKGTLVFVDGRLQLDTWETSQGEKRSRHRVVARSVQVLGGRSREGTRESTDERGEMPPTEEAPRGREPEPEPEEGVGDMPF